MGQRLSVGESGPQELEYYVIRLKPEQSVALYGFMNAKTTLTWKDTRQHPGINLRTCIANGLEPMKLCRMQPDIREWIKIGKATLQDSSHMGPWKPDVFRDLNCNIGDLVIHRKALAPKLLIDGDVTFTILTERYGLTPELMALLHYSADDWLDLGVTSEFLMGLTVDQWTRIFGSIHGRNDLIEKAKRRRATAATNE